MHKPGHKQKYSNRPFASDIPEQKRLEQKRKVSDIKNLKLRGTAGSMQGFISKASEGEPAYYQGNKLGTYLFEKAKGGKIPLNIYERENLWGQWQTQGRPKVRQWSKEEFTKAGAVFKDPEEKAWYHGEPRAFYSGSSNRMTIEPGDVPAFLAELPHSAQWGSEDKSKRTSLWDKFKAPWLRMTYGEKVYDMPSHLEYQAHTEIQPKLEESFMTATPKSYKRPYRSEY